MTQVASKKRIEIRNERVKVIAHFLQQGSVLAGTQRGEAEDFSIELSIDANVSEQTMRELMELAHHMCFTEHALQGSAPTKLRHVFNGRSLE